MPWNGYHLIWLAAIVSLLAIGFMTYSACAVIAALFGATGYVIGRTTVIEPVKAKPPTKLVWRQVEAKEEKPK